MVDLCCDEELQVVINGNAEADRIKPSKSRVAGIK
jgi:hypothetical protein